MERIIKQLKLDPDILTDRSKADVIMKKLPKAIASNQKSVMGSPKVVATYQYLLYGLKVKYGIQVKSNQVKFDKAKATIAELAKPKPPPEPEPEPEPESTDDDTDVTTDDFVVRTGTDKLRHPVFGTMTWDGKFWREKAGGDGAVVALHSDAGDDFTEVGQYDADTGEVEMFEGAKEGEVYPPKEAAFNDRGYFGEFESFKRLGVEEQKKKNPDLFRVLHTYRSSDEGKQALREAFALETEKVQEMFRRSKGSRHSREEYEENFTLHNYATGRLPFQLGQVGGMEEIVQREGYTDLPTHARQIYGTEEEFQAKLDKISKREAQEQTRLREFRRGTRASRMGEFTGEARDVEMYEFGYDEERLKDEPDAYERVVRKVRPFNFKGKEYLADVSDPDAVSGRGMSLFIPVPSGGMFAGELWQQSDDTDDEDLPLRDDAFDASVNSGARVDLWDEAVDDLEYGEEGSDARAVFEFNRGKDFYGQEGQADMPDEVGTAEGLGFKPDKYNRFGFLRKDGKRYFTQRTYDNWWGETHKTRVNVYDLDEALLRKHLDEDRGIAKEGQMEYDSDEEEWVSTAGKYRIDDKWIQRGEFLGEFDTATMEYVDEIDMVGQKEKFGVYGSEGDDSEDDAFYDDRRERVRTRERIAVNLAEKEKRQVFIDQMKSDGTLRGTLEKLVISSAFTPPDSGRM